MIQVVVTEARGGLPKAQFVLQQDNWDDFGFKTLYQLHYFGGSDETFIGSVKILRRGQRPSATSLLDAGPLEPLSDDYCSVGQSLDYYERLAALPFQLRDEVLAFFRDAIAFPGLAEEFGAEDGWRTSLLRDLDLDSYRPLARTLLERDYTQLASKGLKLTFAVAGWQAPLVLEFQAPEQPVFVPYIFGDAPPLLPERVAVITGRNGSGKSTLLARLARVLHATQGDRKRPELARLGTIEPDGIGFSRIVTIAYSAFDTFQVPGLSDREKRQIVSDVREGAGRYVFAGLRDIGRELEDRLEANSVPGAAVTLDRQPRTYLKPSEQLAAEYHRMIAKISVEGRTPLLHRVGAILLGDPSFSDVPEQSPELLFGLKPAERFMEWSTGHKIVLHAIATLVSATQRKTIVLLDEPESHLHPPLLAAFMHAMRVILEEYDAFAVVATHSPVVAQETLGRHVSVVTRIGDRVTITPPRIETYGESIGAITDELFGLHPAATDYHSALRQMVENGESLEQIAARFEKGMSVQAHAYVLSLIAMRSAV